MEVKGIIVLLDAQFYTKTIDCPTSTERERERESYVRLGCARTSKGRPSTGTHVHADEIGLCVWFATQNNMIPEG